MKGTESFKEEISAYLGKVAAEDQVFAAKYANPEKSIDDCITYILNQVKASGMNGFADAEIYGMAMHYYDEEKVEVGGKIQCKVVVNHAIELTEQEKEQARQRAIDEHVAMEKAKLKGKKPEPAKQEKTAKTVEVHQPLLFEL